MMVGVRDDGGYGDGMTMSMMSTMCGATGRKAGRQLGSAGLGTAYGAAYGMSCRGYVRGELRATAVTVRTVHAVWCRLRYGCQDDQRCQVSMYDDDDVDGRWVGGRRMYVRRMRAGCGGRMRMSMSWVGATMSSR